LINEAIYVPLQFAKTDQVILQSREALLAGNKAQFKICAFKAASRIDFAILDLREERHH
jgi:hypothetical protein